jgi:uncharacterized membrane protein YqiK
METLLEQLRLRQIAFEQEQTFAAQEAAAVKKRSLNEMMARADQQSEVTKSALAITIAQNEGLAETSRQTEAAAGIRVTADAEAYGVEVRARAIGGTENIIRQLALETLGKAIRESRMPLVPATLIEGSGDGLGGNLMAALLALCAKNAASVEPGGPAS